MMVRTAAIFLSIESVDMANSPAFQFYPDKWESHTGHLSDSAYRVYHRMICWMWQHSEDQCSIPSDPAIIAILMRTHCSCIADALREIQNPHMPLLRQCGDKLKSRGLEKEANKQQKRRKQAKNAAKARWDIDQNTVEEGKEKQCVRIGFGANQQCPPSPSPFPTPYNCDSPEPTPDKSKPKQARFTPPDPSAVTKYAQSIDFDLDGSQFCDFYASKGWMIGRNRMKDWKAAVRTWKRADKKRSGKGKSLAELMADRETI